MRAYIVRKVAYKGLWLRNGLLAPKFIAEQKSAFFAELRLAARCIIISALFPLSVAR